MTAWLYKWARREPFVLCAWVAFLCVWAEGNIGSLWMLPAWLAAVFAAACADELWQTVMLGEESLFRDSGGLQ